MLLLVLLCCSFPSSFCLCHGLDVFVSVSSAICNMGVHRIGACVCALYAAQTCIPCMHSFQVLLFCML